MPHAWQNPESDVHAALVSLESMVPPEHPLRRIKPLVDDALRRLSPTFDAMYAEGGRPSVPPERLLKAMVLMALYSVRSERLFCEQLGYNMLFRWFLDMGMTEAAFVPTVFTHNRERLIDHEVGRKFFTAVLDQARANGWLSSDHFQVTRLENACGCRTAVPRGRFESSPQRSPQRPGLAMPRAPAKTTIAAPGVTANPLSRDRWRVRWREGARSRETTFVGPGEGEGGCRVYVAAIWASLRDHGTFTPLARMKAEATPDGNLLALLEATIEARSDRFTGKTKYTAAQMATRSRDLRR